MMRNTLPPLASNELLLGGALGCSNSTTNLLAPIIYKIDAWPVVTRFVRPTHYHALHICAKPAREHLPISLITCRVDTGNQARQIPARSHLFACIKQAAEMLLRSWPRTHRPKLDVVDAASRL